MSTHNKCFHGEIKKNIRTFLLTKKSVLSGDMKCHKKSKHKNVI